MPPRPQPSRLSRWLLTRVTSPTRADAIVGDVLEQHTRVEPSNRWSRRHIEVEMWRHIRAHLASLVPAALITSRIVARDVWRSVLATPAVSALVVGILTVAIAAVTVTFSVVDAVVLRPLPYPEPDRLVMVELRRSDTMTNITTLPVFVYEQLQTRAGSFDALAAVRRGNEQLSASPAPQPVVAARVTSTLFDVLRTRPLLGQPFDAKHEVAGNDLVAVIGYDLWQRLGGNPDVVGQALPLVDRTVTILGVMPQGFSYPLADDRRPEIWTPFVAPDDERSGAQLSQYLHVVGRLAPSASASQASAEVDVIFQSLEVPGPGSLEGLRTSVVSLRESLVGAVETWMLLVLGAVALVLLVACANVANILLARAARRSRELAVRASIGASRRQLVATLVLESLSLSLTAAVLGIALAAVGIDAARSLLPTGIARAQDIAVDWRVVAVAASAAILTGLTFGLVPAGQATRLDLLSLLKPNANQTRRGRMDWRTAFLVAQVAFVSVLLVATTLIVTSFVRLAQADLGFDRQRLLNVTGLAGLPGSLAELTHAIEDIPGVEAVGGFANGSAPLSLAAGFGGGSSGTRIWRPGSLPADRASVSWLRTGPGYFKAAGITVIDGQDFAEADLGRTDRLIVDQATARRLFGEQSPVGHSISFGNGTPATIVGVVSNVRDRGPEASANATVYGPTRVTASGHQLLVRTAADPTGVIPALRTVLDQRLPPESRSLTIRPLEDAFRVITAERRFAAGLMSGFGILAVLLGAAGVYAVIWSTVSLQMRDFGIKLALGATPSGIVTGVLRRALQYVAVGLMIGLPSGWLVTQGASSLLYDVDQSEPLTYVLVAGVIAGAALLSAAVPALRAARVDPQITLRTE